MRWLIVVGCALGVWLLVRADRRERQRHEYLSTEWLADARKKGLL